MLNYGKKILNKTKNHNPPPPPPFKLNGRSLTRIKLNQNNDQCIKHWFLKCKEQ